MAVTIVKQIDVSTKRRYHGASTSELSIKGILLAQGYTEKQIDEMRKENRVLIIPEYRTKLRGRQRLVIVDKVPFTAPKDNLGDRFEDLEEE